MAEYTYVATTKQGQQVKGVREAENRDDVAQFLHDQDLIVISIDEKFDLNFKKIGSLQIGGVPLKERVIFVKQLATMLSAGLPIIQALDILVQQTTNDALKSKLQKVYKSVESGASLSEAFRKEKAIFSELQINLLVAGEKSGNLNEVMGRIAVDMEKSKDLRSKIMGAMIYPVILFVVMIAVIIVMIIFLIPSVKDLYANFNEELPWMTQVLVTISEFMSNPLGIIIFISVPVLIVFGLRYYYMTPKGRHVMDRIILKIPVFGALTAKVQLAEFNRLLSMLLKSGVPIVDTLNIVANAMSNVLFRDLIHDSAQEVIKGKSLTIPLTKGEIFPLILLKMLATGEATGNLDKVSADMAEFYNKEVDEITSNLTKLLEPFILVVVGLMVAFLAVAVYLPLYDLGQRIQ